MDILAECMFCAMYIEELQLLKFKIKYLQQENAALRLGKDEITPRRTRLLLLHKSTRGELRGLNNRL